MLANRKECQKACKELRETQKVGRKQKRRELKEQTMRDSLRVVEKERLKQGIPFDAEAIVSHPLMNSYLDGKEEKIGLRDLIAKIEAAIGQGEPTKKLKKKKRKRSKGEGSAKAEDPDRKRDKKAKKKLKEFFAKSKFKEDERDSSNKGEKDGKTKK